MILSKIMLNAKGYCQVATQGPSENFCERFSPKVIVLSNEYIMMISLDKETGKRYFKSW